MIKIMILLISSCLIGIGVNMFLSPFHLINGGIFGVCLIIKYLWGLNVGHAMLMINIPIYLLALKFDISYFFNAILGLAFSSTIIDLLMPLNGFIHLPIVTCSILGGVIIGTGVGLMLRFHISPGAVDLIALLLSKSKGINPGIIIFIIDSLIVLTGILVLKNLNLMYSFITISCVGFCVTLIHSFKTINFFAKR